MKIKAQNLSWSVEAQQIIKSISLHVYPGEFIGIIGPNGSGKSSLIRLIYRFYPPDAGAIYLDARDILKMSNKETAQCVAVVTQESSDDFDFTVYEMVMMGRTPHKKLLDADTAEDDTIIRDSLKRVGMLSLAQRDFYTLSGGEKQRVLIARALAQRARVLILDEPTNHLDIRYQLEVLEIIHSLGITTIAVMHDLNLTAAYCDRIYLLKSGKVVAHGKPRDILTAEQIKSVYGVDVEVEIRPSTGRLNIVFIKANSSDYSYLNSQES
jgi:iron complex transport system ATP-binding protein